MLNVIRSHQRSSTYRLSSAVARVKSSGGGQNMVAPGRTQEVKQGWHGGGKLQNGGGTRGWGKDLLLGSVSSLHLGKIYAL